MNNWPQSVSINAAGLDALRNLLSETATKITKEMTTATDFGVARRKDLLSQITLYLQSLGGEINDNLRSAIPNAYKMGANQAVDQLKSLSANVPIATGFNSVHKEAIAALYSDAATSFAESLQGVKRSSTQILNKVVKTQITNDIAGGIAKGDTLKTAKNTIKSTLADNGFTALVDKRGRKWSLDDYAEMLYRTKMVEARNLGMVNRMAENGYDLVQVSAHGAVDQCGKWEGKILSSTGATAGYPTVDDATADGLFHPNCRHAINAIVPDLFAEVKQYNKDTGEYQKIT